MNISRTFISFKAGVLSIDRHRASIKDIKEITEFLDTKNINYLIQYI